MVQPHADALSVHAAGFENGFRAAGDTRFAHLYFMEGFARRVGAELFGEAGDREGLLFRDDLVFVQDAELRRMACD